MGRAHLHVHKPPEATLPMGSFPAQNATEHKHEQDEISDKRGEDADPGVQDMIKNTTAVILVPAGSDCD